MEGQLREFPARRACLLAVCFCRVLLATVYSSFAGKLPEAPGPLAYDTSAYELAPEFRLQVQPWSVADLKNAFRQRVALEKQRREFDVDYYRIGYTLSFPLPLSMRPKPQELPGGILKSTYPWMIWLSWDLEERWRLLDLARRQFGDREAGALLQRELAALSTWDRFCENDGAIGLATAHIAASLSLALEDTSKWDPELLKQTRNAAEALLDRDAWPWFQKQWPERPLTPDRIGNIPVITLVRSAQLARVVSSPHEQAFETRACEVLHAWGRFRLGSQHHTEGAAYDGYLLDSVTEWLAGLSDRDELLQECRLAFRSQADQWMNLTLPGRPDLQAALGDVEPEMTFWASVLMRLADWYQWSDSQWLLRRFPVQRMRAACLAAALDQKPTGSARLEAPRSGPRELPNALTLRTGWEEQDLLTVVGLSRSAMGRLHADGGHLILGWGGRFWITDPGYQQYRPGEERDYTLGTQAHNPPVIGGVAQTERTGQLERLEIDLHGWQHAAVDLSHCYRGLPAGASVRRDVWLVNEGGRAVVVRDTFDSLGTNVEVKTSWQVGAHLAWAFRTGWARLSDGQRALWVGTDPGELDASLLTRHPGTRGGLTLTHTARLLEGRGTRWFVFCCDPSGGWQPPTLESSRLTLKLMPPGTPPSAWFID